MPELPEVETVMRGLSPVLNGRIIDHVQIRRKDLRIPFPRGLKKSLEGRRIQNLERRAKYILMSLDAPFYLVIHLGMSGRISIINDENYKPEKHDHFILTLENGQKIVYNDPRRFGMIFTVSESEKHTHKAFHHLGPEPLGNQFSPDVLKKRLANKNTNIKQALLDQRVVVGVGNIYASEALYLAGIHPKRKAGSISAKRIEKLYYAIQNVLNKAIDAGGSTLKDYRRADGELGYFQHAFQVYDREGLSCGDPKCACGDKGGVKKITQGGRSTFYCPHKQK